MASFFELRIYQVQPGKMQEWLSFMEEIVIPFQVKQGMVIHGSFTMDSTDEFFLKDGERVMDSTQKGETYVWIRRFESAEQKEKLYKAVYESEEWTNNIGPRVGTLIDRNSIVVHNLSATALSVMK
jgi:hypothetical protein